MKKKQDHEIKTRIKAFGRHSTIMKGILLAMTYTAETWTLRTKMERKLSAAQHTMERNMLSITYKYRKTNKKVMDQTKVIDIMKIFIFKWTWVGHISRRTDNRWSAALTVGDPWVGKEIEVGNEKGGKMNYNSTGAM